MKKKPTKYADGWCPCPLCNPARLGRRRRRKNCPQGYIHKKPKKPEFSIDISDMYYDET